MAYAFFIHASTSSPGTKVQCIPSGKNATLLVPATKANKEVLVTWVGDTEYDMDAGDALHNYSFRGVDPVQKLLSTTVASGKIPDYNTLLRQHAADIKKTLWDSFSLDLGQRTRADIPTDALMAAYAIDDGNSYIEWVLFNYGRYMLATSGRGALPANLQGKWGNGLTNAWGADYHANINLQMNYWAAEMTGLGDLSRPLFDYIEKTWAPRGAETAKILYNISRGWMTHNEMNIFGHTGMKTWYQNSAEFADYPEANAWMMFHVWDHFDHTNDVAWWRQQGWPLLKGVASFHLDKLIPDLYFNDSTLVVNPCNSPEQKPITFGCAHSQQVIWQLFNAVEKGFEASGDTDVSFLQEVRRKRAQMDKGLKIGSWKQLQEWKVEKDSPTDKHRHLSHLIGLYPGYAIAGYDPTLQGAVGSQATYSRKDILDAATVSLDHRGNGTAPDADSGWEKVWRAAAWAQLGDKERFYHILSFMIYENFAPNLFSIYGPGTDIFQIDANLGYPAAVMNALIQAPDVPNYNTPLTITLLAALPEQWAAKGSVRGARVRGGMTVDVEWKGGKLVGGTITVNQNAMGQRRNVQVVYGGKVISSFTTSPGLTKTLRA